MVGGAIWSRAAANARMRAGIRSEKRAVFIADASEASLLDERPYRRALASAGHTAGGNCHERGR